MNLLDVYRKNRISSETKRWKSIENNKVVAKISWENTNMIKIAQRQMLFSSSFVTFTNSSFYWQKFKDAVEYDVSLVL